MFPSWSRCFLMVISFSSFSQTLDCIGESFTNSSSSITMDVPRPSVLQTPLQVQERTLMGPGPSNCSPRVLKALSLPVIGHFHQATFKIMDEIKAGLQYVFQTRNALTLAVSASGHGGMEAALSNLIEPGEKVLILTNGIWGQRAADMASRYGGNVVKLEAPAGTNFNLTTIEDAVKKEVPSVLFVTQGESSTGVHQPIEGIGPICHRHNCLLIVDTVASLGGVTFYADRWGVDCVYTGTQKVLGAPPGLAPISFSPKAQEKIEKRKSPPAVYYFDMKPLGQYWDCYPGQPRVYHHTISTTLLYGLREALAMISEEGIEECITRHVAATKLLYEGLDRLGFKLFVEDEAARLPTVTTVVIPPKLNWSKLVASALNEFDLEIAGGLGPTAGKVLRIGVMGVNANPSVIQRCLDVLEKTMKHSQL